MAVDSLRSVAALLTEAHQPLAEVVHGRPDVPEGASLETVFSAVKATADVSCSRHASGTCKPKLSFLCLYQEPSVTTGMAGQGCAWSPRPTRGRQLGESGLRGEGQCRCEAVPLRLQDVHVLMSAPHLQVLMAGMQPQGHGCSDPSCKALTLAGLANTFRTFSVSIVWC